MDVWIKNQDTYLLKTGFRSPAVSSYLKMLSQRLKFVYIKKLSSIWLLFFFLFFFFFLGLGEVYFI